MTTLVAVRKDRGWGGGALSLLVFLIVAGTIPFVVVVDAACLSTTLVSDITLTFGPTRAYSCPGLLTWPTTSVTNVTLVFEAGAGYFGSGGSIAITPTSGTLVGLHIEVQGVSWNIGSTESPFFTGAGLSDVTFSDSTTLFKNSQIASAVSNVLLGDTGLMRFADSTLRMDSTTLTITTSTSSYGLWIKNSQNFSLEMWSSSIESTSSTQWSKGAEIDACTDCRVLLNDGSTIRAIKTQGTWVTQALRLLSSPRIIVELHHDSLIEASTTTSINGAYAIGSNSCIDKRIFLNGSTLRVTAGNTISVRALDIFSSPNTTVEVRNNSRIESTSAGPDTCGIRVRTSDDFILRVSQSTIQATTTQAAGQSFGLSYSSRVAITSITNSSVTATSTLGGAGKEIAIQYADDVSIGSVDLVEARFFGGTGLSSMLHANIIASAVGSIKSVCSTWNSHPVDLWALNLNVSPSLVLHSPVCTFTETESKSETASLQATPTPTLAVPPTATQSKSEVATRTSTHSVTGSRTETVTTTVQETPSDSLSISDSPTKTRTPTATASHSNTITSSNIATASATPTAPMAATATETETPTASLDASSSNTHSVGTMTPSRGIEIPKTRTETSTLSNSIALCDVFGAVPRHTSTEFLSSTIVGLVVFNHTQSNSGAAGTLSSSDLHLSPASSNEQDEIVLTAANLTTALVASGQVTGINITIPLNLPVMTAAENNVGVWSPLNLTSLLRITHFKSSNDGAETTLQNFIVSTSGWQPADQVADTSTRQSHHRYTLHIFLPGSSLPAVASSSNATALAESIFVSVNRTAFECEDVAISPRSGSGALNFTILINPTKFGAQQPSDARSYYSQIRDGFQRTLVATTAIGALTGSHGNGLAQVRAATLVSLRSCVYDHEGVLSALFSPLGLKFGKTHGQYYRGGIKGNLILLVALAASFLLLAVICFVARKLKSPIAMSDGTAWGNFVDELVFLHMPSVLIVPICLCLPGTVAISMALFIHSNDAEDIALAVLGGVVSLAILVCVGLVSTKFFRMVLVKRPETLEREKAEKEKSSAPPTAGGGGGQTSGAEEEKKCAPCKWWADFNSSKKKWVNINPESRWKRSYFLFFHDYSISWFFLIEIGLTFLMGIIEGIRIANTTVCTSLAGVSLLLYLSVVFLAVKLSPSLTKFQHYFFVGMNAFCALASLGTLITLLTDSEWLHQVNDVINLFIMSVGIIKFCLDVYNAVSAMWKKHTLQPRKSAHGRARSTTFAFSPTTAVNMGDDGDNLSAPLNQEENGFGHDDFGAPEEEMRKISESAQKGKVPDSAERGWVTPTLSPLPSPPPEAPASAGVLQLPTQEHQPVTIPSGGSSKKTVHVLSWNNNPLEYRAPAVVGSDIKKCKEEELRDTGSQEQPYFPPVPANMMAATAVADSNARASAPPPPATAKTAPSSIAAPTGKGATPQSQPQAATEMSNEEWESL